MEICFENKKINAFCEVLRQTKRIQESIESVVPDTNDDIGRIVSAQTEILLKNKDVNSRGVSVGGEVSAVILYLTESEDRVSFLRVSRGFSIEYEIPDADADMIPQVSLNILNSEARILNPRKISVLFEICGELSCYREDSVCIENSLPEASGIELHTKYEQGEIILNNTVCEKTFALNEQFVFPAGKAVPEKIIFCRADLAADDLQMIGSKIIVKGNLGLTVYYLSSDENYPGKAEFSAPFSQIIDTGRENNESCTAFITRTSAYYELTDSISGEKTLEVEIHAVTQAISRCRRNINYITDAYSNEMPALCKMGSRQFNTAVNHCKTILSKDEQIAVSEDCEDVLCVFTSIIQTSQQQNKLGCTVSADILYKNKNGMLSAVRRILELEGEGTASARILGARLSNIYLRPEGGTVNARITAEISCINCVTTEFMSVNSVVADEENTYDFAAFPTLMLVKAEKESIWELAKEYHSCTERIASMNDTEDIQGKILLIPKSI